MINIIFTPSMLLAFIIWVICYLLILVQKHDSALSGPPDSFCVISSMIYSFGILLHGWRFDPILLLSQFILVTLLFLLIYEVLSLRNRLR